MHTHASTRNSDNKKSSQIVMCRCAGQFLSWQTQGKSTKYFGVFATTTCIASWSVGGFVANNWKAFPPFRRKDEYYYYQHTLIPKPIENSVSVCETKLKFGRKWRPQSNRLKHSLPSFAITGVDIHRTHNGVWMEPGITTPLTKPLVLMWPATLNWPKASKIAQKHICVTILLNNDKV